ncbi:hypothetical protein HMPREF0083_04948 [Aneurinibacillus aneurinilyticus ATCC 12856]|uniref:Uncharacterized protein n=1 Tax=Aneurinibacillus aneurinilyticus ATCC 12856 TaxID=649747 RepID=U1Y459_ANEAE|nr:hypothetical protein HMPREF0083_04948 [Aneurinibacillus aneurinilyticus ATCC 12856]
MLLYTPDSMKRYIFVAGDKKRRKGGGRERSEKDMLSFLLPERRAHRSPSFFRIFPFQPPKLLLLHQVISI